jgi:hypothetical protein
MSETELKIQMWCLGISGAFIGVTALVFFFASLIDYAHKKDESQNDDLAKGRGE